MPYIGKEPSRTAFDASDIPDDSITAAKIVDGAITIADIADDAVTEDKLANAINTAIAANTAKVTNATHTGEVTGSGALTITADAVTGAKIADNAIDSEHIAADSIDAEHYAAGSVDGTAIANDAVDSQHIAADSIDAEHYAAGSVDGTAIANDAVDSQHYAAASIDNEHLADNAVDTAEIADNAVTLAKMAGGTDGNIISFDASGDPVAIATGNDGQILTSAGAGAPPAFEDAAGGGGKILQVVNMTTSTSTGVSDATWTATSVTLAITPSATSSKILLMWSGQMYIQNTAGDGGYAHHFSQAISGGATTAPVELHSNSAVNYSSHYTQQTSGQFSHYVTTHGLVSPSTTSAITYTLYIINYNANGVGVNSQGGKSNLTLMEIDGS